MAVDVRPSSATAVDPRRRRRLRGVLIAGLAVATAFLLSGCLTLKMDLQVQSDDTVDGSLTLAFDKSVLQSLGQDPSAFASELSSQGPFPSASASGSGAGSGSVTAEPYDQDGKIGTTWKFTDVPLSQFNDSEDQDGLRIERTGDTFTLSGTLDLTSDQLGAGATDAPIDTSQFASTFEVSIRVGFPGPVISSNGTIDGNTVTWTPKLGEKVQLQAVAKAQPADGDAAQPGDPASSSSSSGGSSLLVPLLVGLVVALVVAGVVGFLVVRGRRPAHAGATGTPPPPPPGTAYPPAPDTQYPPAPAPGTAYPPAPAPGTAYPPAPEQPTQVLPPPAAPPTAPPPTPPAQAAPPSAPSEQSPAPPEQPPPPSGPPVAPPQ